MKNILSTILPVAGVVCLLAAFVGIINRLFDTKLGVGTLSSGASTDAIPGDPVIIGFFLVVSAACLLVQVLRGRKSAAAVATQNADNRI